MRELNSSFEDFDTNSPLFEKIWYRETVYTMYLSIANMLYFTVMWGVGFTFVSLVNLKNRNGNPFKDSEGTYKDFIKTLIFSQIFYFISGIVVLR